LVLTLALSHLRRAWLSLGSPSPLRCTAPTSSPSASRNKLDSTPPLFLLDSRPFVCIPPRLVAIVRILRSPASSGIPIGPDCPSSPSFITLSLSPSRLPLRLHRRIPSHPSATLHPHHLHTRTICPPSQGTRPFELALDLSSTQTRQTSRSHPRRPSIPPCVFCCCAWLHHRTLGRDRIESDRHPTEPRVRIATSS
jgi:hypothetical protein